MTIDRFPFARLPTDLQLIILDYLVDRRNPTGQKLPMGWDYGIFGIYKSELLFGWTELRLVCRQWCRWFGLDAIHSFSGLISILVKGYYLSRMTNLRSLEAYDQFGESGPEIPQLFAQLLPASVRELYTCEISVLRNLSAKRLFSLQSINFQCQCFKSFTIGTIKSVFKKHGDRVKQIHLFYNDHFLNARQMKSWRRALCDLPIEELRFHGHRSLWYEWMPILPPTLKRMHVLGSYREFGNPWYLPVCDSLEEFSGPGTFLFLERNMPVFSALKQLTVEMIGPREGTTLDDDMQNSMHVYFPNLEKLVFYNFTSDEPIGMQHMHSLRYLKINGFKQENVFSLDCLPPLLEEFSFSLSKYSRHLGIIAGQPPLMPNLRKLNLQFHYCHAPSNVFKAMSRLEELSIITLPCDGQGRLCINLRELIPLCDTLTSLEVSVNAQSVNKENRDVFFRLTRLQHLILDAVGNETTAIQLDRLPPTLETLQLRGVLEEGIPMEPLPNLHKLEVRNYKNTESASLLRTIIRNSPALRYFDLDLDKDETSVDIDDCRMPKVRRLTICTQSDCFRSTVVPLLRACRNIDCFEYKMLPYDINFPPQFLSFIQYNPIFSLQRLVIIYQGWYGLPENVILAVNVVLQYIRSLGIALSLKRIF